MGATYTVETDRTLEGVFLTRGDANAGTGIIKINGSNFLYWEATAAGGAVFIPCDVPLSAGDVLHSTSTGGLAATFFFRTPDNGADATT